MKKRIGIVGGGQLGKMLASAAHKLGHFVTVLDPTPGCPAAQSADAHIVGNFKDKESVLKLGEVSDFITFEIELANVEGLEELMKKNIHVNPTPQTLAIIKDKHGQKVFLRNAGIPVADFALINSEKECYTVAEKFGYPFILKARFDAYDGRGNFVIRSEADIPLGYKKLNASPLYAERYIPFSKELAVVCARDTFGDVAHFPVVETIHKNNICHIVRSPAPIDQQLRIKAEKLAEQSLKALAGVGVFAFEMFLTVEGDVLINEIAPRVHNSGHHTIEGFTVSQFEQHIRVITGMHVEPPKPLSPICVMVNILGERSGKAEVTGVSQAEALGNLFVHIYGKEETRIERKMGHITALGNEPKETEERALSARALISI